MRLSEAILLGSTLSKQGFGPEALYQEERCAIGAALQALNVQVHHGSTCFGYAAIHKEYPELKDLRPSCPAGHCNIALDHGSNAISVIWHLNDIHEWSRERIAEWVSTIEPQPVEELREEADEVLAAYLPPDWTKDRWIRAMSEHRGEGE